MSRGSFSQPTPQATLARTASLRCGGYLRIFAPSAMASVKVLSESSFRRFGGGETGEIAERRCGPHVKG
jgi:hypothetical protein